MFAKGQLPAWRVISSDLRSNDAVRSFVEIPATIIDNGEFKNVPYKSFRVNHDIELNIYGDPEDPAALEVGIFGKRAKLERLRRLLRGYLAGYLTTRDEIAKLYSLGLQEGLTSSGDLTIEVTPTTAPDAYGAWWISLYNPKALAAARVSDAEYVKATLPPDQVVDRSGKVKDRVLSEGGFRSLSQMRKGGDTASFFTLGFSRDAAGQLRLPFQSDQ
jgi:hypothetical protein